MARACDLLSVLLAHLTWIATSLPTTTPRLRLGLCFSVCGTFLIFLSLDISTGVHVLCQNEGWRGLSPKKKLLVLPHPQKLVFSFV